MLHLTDYYNIQDNKIIFNAGPFSPHFPATFMLNGLRYRSAEHFYLAQQAYLFDYSKFEEVLLTKPEDFGKFKDWKLKDFDPEVWKEERRGILIAGNLAKFSQNEELGDFLVETGSVELIYESGDLGEILMEVRGLLRIPDPIESFGMYPAIKD